MKSIVKKPWGSYQILEEGPKYSVKKIIVDIGGKLSLQKHTHRSEHWVVVKGTALVEKDGEKQLLGENESTFIPLGCKHRLTNPGKMSMELIEIHLCIFYMI